MKIAILADIHANAYALRAVLEDCQDQDVDEYWALGDFVGYGPHPVPALRFLCQYVRPDAWVMGNHDAMMADLLLAEEKGARELRLRVGGGKVPEIRVRGVFMSSDEWKDTNAAPVDAIVLNRSALAKDIDIDTWWQAAFTRERISPASLEVDNISCVLVHASQEKPLSRYIYGWHKEIHIPRELAHLEVKGRKGNPVIQFYGHTHVPTFVRAAKQEGGFSIHAERVLPGRDFVLEENSLYLINPGSVGQPRDRDRRSSYLIFDTQNRNIRFRRVEYDYVQTASDLVSGGYQDSLIRRLRDALATEETPDEWLSDLGEAVVHEQ